jgi:hypothetical protein
LLALMLLGPSGALAATPTVSVGSTSATATGTGASPTVVSIGDTVRFQSTLRNDDSSTISQLFVQGFSEASVYSFGTPTQYAVSITKNDAVVDNGCAASTDLSCSVRNVKPTDVVKVTVVYKVPRFAAGSTTVDYGGRPTCDMGFAQGFDTSTSPVTYNTPDDTTSPDLVGPAVCVHFVWSTSGNTTSDGGGTSHGDVWSWYDGAKINSQLTDFRALWVVDQLFVENTQTINADNPHSTRAYAPTAGIPVTVEDIDCDASHYPDPGDVPAICATLTGFGEVSRVDLAGGAPLECPTVGDPHAPCVYHFMLKLDNIEITSSPKGVNHVYPGGFETITTKCTFAKGSSVPSTISCITVKKLPGGDLQVDVWTLHNGSIRLF